MPERGGGRALVLTHGLFRDVHAKTAHGLVRGPSRWPIAGVVDSSCAGRDAGEVLDGRNRDVPIFASLTGALEELSVPPPVCVVGVATEGGVLPADLRAELFAAADAGMTLVNGLHQLLEDDAELVARVESGGGGIVDVRKPRPASELRFWSGEVLALTTPRVAVLGTDCAVGKRTTASVLARELRRRGRRAELIYTGQTGWMQGQRHGFILDATPNDFVTGELERVVLACAAEEESDVILLEGQSALRNPSGPCGAELLVSIGTRGVVLQHGPTREFFLGLEDLGCAIPPLREEIELIRLLGAEVWAVALNDEELDAERAEELRARHEEELGLPVVLPLRGGERVLADAVLAGLDAGAEG
ncbi:MAG: DUF1611 domain-containing protein [Planctomycetota bacterium]|nr:DUF1611 domain-containing protein [Planctomycetota bacterium]